VDQIIWNALQLVCSLLDSGLSGLGQLGNDVPEVRLPRGLNPDIAAGPQSAMRRARVSRVVMSLEAPLRSSCKQSGGTSDQPIGRYCANRVGRSHVEPID
jgi:hypothetical protein